MLTMEEYDSVMKKINTTQIKSKCFCAPLLIETNLFVYTRASFASFGTIPSNLKSTLVGWEAVKFC